MQPATHTIIDKDYEARRRTLLAGELEPEPFGARAIQLLLLEQEHEDAFRELAHVASWFEGIDPTHVQKINEVDFGAIKLCRAWHLFVPEKQLPVEVATAIEQFFTQNNFASKYQSENHALLFHSSLYLMGSALPQAHFEAYGETGATLSAEDGLWLKRFLEYRARHGWGEFNSSHYLMAVWECLLTLYDFSPDSSLQSLARDSLDLLLAEMQVESLYGRQGGAQGRIQPAEALDHSYEVTRSLHYLYWGSVSAPTSNMNGYVVDLVSTRYRPRKSVLALSPESEGASFVLKSRKLLHNLADILPVEPLAGSIRKYTYWTPDYMLGCVQFQDAYPQGTPVHGHIRNYTIPADQIETTAYPWHQQHDWDLSFATSDTARLFAHHPGKDPLHNHWTGDRCCGCGHFMQERNCLLALYDIPSSQPCQYIHIYLPRESFDELREEPDVIFVRAGSAYAALRLSAPYSWTESGEWARREIILEGARHGMACEVGRMSEDGDFDAFIERVRRSTFAFDADSLKLCYKSAQGNELTMDAQGKRCLNGQALDLDYPALESPWLNSGWGNLVTELDGPGGHISLFESAYSDNSDEHLIAKSPR